MQIVKTPSANFVIKIWALVIKSSNGESSCVVLRTRSAVSHCKLVGENNKSLILREPRGVYLDEKVINFYTCRYVMWVIDQGAESSCAPIGLTWRTLAILT